MDNLVVSLGLGVALIAALFFLIYRFTRLRGYQTAGLVLAITMIVFVPLSVLSWSGADVFAIHLALYVIVPYGLGIITTQIEGERGTKAKRGRLHWAPMTILAFFGVVATVNAVLLSWANNGMPTQLVGVFLPEPQSQASEVTSGFPGTVARIGERKEALAVDYVTHLRQQRELGWQVYQGWRSRPTAGEPALFQVRVLDRDGEPISDAAIEGEFMRVSDFSLDQSFAMRPVGGGLYEAQVALPAAGRWDLLFRVQRGDEVHEQQASTSVRATRG
ncbi:FixH family protein [Thioalkalivibrio nitratireducens DSM 14787]|uniref:FixH family protein n=1 Tax=Thioalkalivibrio nitratireducens (strain DSM 14787 / UNIQEM 213 / ALEN2) TaxID=1255043 RepID=L0DQU3_THIND|nr:FixH family protein [Thioalkalivibrio nitratireducens]AGA31909.1 FixH family protein [Thioalkalivibrio nitratireducens DSM 14787]